MSLFTAFSTKWKQRSSDRSGVALLMAVFVIVTLTALVVSFLSTTQRNLHLTRHYKNGVQAYWTAQSGLQAAVAGLQLDALQKQQLQQGGYDGYTACWNAESTCYQEAALALLSIPMCGSSYPQAALLPAMRDPLAAEQTPRSPCLIVDENRKLSIRDLVTSYGQQAEQTDEKVFLRLQYVLGAVLKETDLLSAEERLQDSGSSLSSGTGFFQPISDAQAETLAGYLLDWADTFNNSETRYNADRAEESCPEDGLPYSAKNGNFDSIEEIALVCGFRQMQRHVIEELGRNLTVYSVETNINTATQPVLHALIAAALDEPNPDETFSAELYDFLHPTDEIAVPEDHIIKNDTDYTSVLQGHLGMDTDLITALIAHTGIASTVFRVGVNGVVYDPETGGVEANATVTMVISFTGGQTPGQQQGAGLLYYREG